MKRVRRIVIVEAFRVANKKSQELTTKLTKAERDKKSVEAALDGAKKQAEAQRKQLHQAKADLATTRDQIKALSKKLEEAEKAKDQVEQDGYEVGVAKIEEAFRAEVSEVCRYYCLQVWNEALNQAGVKASSALRKAESMYYPPGIRALGSSGFKTDTAFKEADVGNESPTKTLPLVQSPSKEVELPEVAEKPAGVTKEVAYDAIQPPVAPKDQSKEKEVPHNMEIILATLPIPTKEDLKDKSLASSKATSTQPGKTSKDKLVIKIKP